MPRRCIDGFASNDTTTYAQRAGPPIARDIVVIHIGDAPVVNDDFRALQGCGN